LPACREPAEAKQMQDTSTNAYVVAVDRRRVGVAVASGDGFRFIAADPAFLPLDGSSFRHLAQLEQAAARLARAVIGPAGAPASGPAVRAHWI
jgi:hypothetical protein